MNAETRERPPHGAAAVRCLSLRKRVYFRCSDFARARCTRAYTGVQLADQLELHLS